MNIELLGWVATGILLVGYFLNAKKQTISWLFWIVGNTLMGIYAYLINSMSVVFLSLVLIGLNVYGYYSWKRDK
tara:strand:+ start:629 stop:850 length:222 start_codon:yes stop_codon:yes gene_type:complete